MKIRAGATRLVFCALIAVLSAACDKDGNLLQEPGLDKLTRGVSVEQDVLSAMGKPDMVWIEDDGTRVLQYPKGPAGSRTWEFVIGRDGTLAEYRQLLTEDNFARIQSGMSRGEVLRILGRPRTSVQFKRKNEEVLDWRYQSPFGERFFNVHFDLGSGKVTATSSSDAYIN